MEKYTKKILVALSPVLLLVFFLVVWLFNLSFLGCVIMTSTVLLLGVIAIRLNKWMRTYLNPNVYPVNAWYRNHLERNYDCIILGDGTVDYQTHESKVFDFRLHDQTLLWDFKTLKHFFSILKPEGKAVFTLSTNGFLTCYKDVKDVRPYYFDYMAYVFTKQHWRILLIKVLKRFPILMIRPKDVFYYIAALCGKDVEEMRSRKVIKKECRRVYSDKDYESSMQLVRDIKAFCEEREIIPVFHVVARSEEENELKNKIQNRLTAFGCELV